jgi:UDP-N-acetyl-2-amino-2-deoxyglucuronate dehydrogenase
MSKIKFAVLGCGHIGKRHAEMIIRNDDSELVALIDNKENIKDNLLQFNVPFFKSIDLFLKSGIAVDVINIATPNGLHA